jgi:polyisoprenoid-binding protein YceI
MLTKCLIFIFLILWIVSSRATVLDVDSTRNNSVIFYASSTLGNFEGKTDNIRGNISWQDDDTLGSGKVHLQVDLRTLDTGIGLRNSHMRDKYLQTSRYPEAVYEGQLSEWQRIDDSTSRVVTSGTLKIHGVAKPFSAAATVQQIEAIYRITTNFEMNVANFNIKQPKFLFTSMKKVIRLKLIFYIKPVSNP